MQAHLKKLAEATWFTNTITIVILFAGILVGVETYQEFAQRHHTIIGFLDQMIVLIFVAEVLIKMGAEGKRPWRYFMDPWNIFDFLIVAACFLPVDTQYVMVLRLARLLRVLKLVRALPKLQILVGALLQSIPSMAYVSLLLIMLFYVYAVACTFMFGANDPIHFATLPLSMVSLFRVVTLEDWTDIMYINRDGCDQYGYDAMPQLCTAPEAFPIGSYVIFITLVLLGTMIIMNLFIGVIMSGMEAAKVETEADAKKDIRESLAPVSLAHQMDELIGEIDVLRSKLVDLKNQSMEATDGA